MLSTNGGCIYGLAYKDQTTNVGELGIWVIELYIHSSIADEYQRLFASSFWLTSIHFLNKKADLMIKNTSQCTSY